MAMSRAGISDDGWGSAMDVDGSSSTRMISRFSTLNRTAERQNGILNNGNMIITAGFDVNSCGHSECPNTYETRVIHEDSQDTERIPIRTAICSNVPTRPGLVHRHANQGRYTIATMTIEHRFQIFVKNFDGHTSTYEVTNTTSVDAFKNMIRDRLGIPPDQQILNFAGKILVTGNTLGHYKIVPESTIFLTGRLRGGRKN